MNLKMLNRLNTVIEWNQVFGNDMDNATLIPVYKKLCIEESQELIDAMDKNDYAEEIDAICDLIYVVGMGAVLQGATYRQLTTTCEKGSAVKLHKVIKEGNLIRAWRLLVDMSEHLEKVYDLDGAFDRVTKSNYSKAIPNAEFIDIGAEMQYVEDQGDYADIFAVTSPCEKYIILKAKRDLRGEGRTFETGKIVKPCSFKSVEQLGGLSEFIKDKSWIKCDLMVLTDTSELPVITSDLIREFLFQPITSELMTSISKKLSDNIEFRPRFENGELIIKMVQK